VGNNANDILRPEKTIQIVFYNTNLYNTINITIQLRLIMVCSYVLWSHRLLFSYVPRWIGCRNMTCAWPADRTNAGIRGSWAGSNSCCSLLSSRWLKSRRISDFVPPHVSDSYLLHRHCSLPKNIVRYLLLIYLLNLEDNKLLHIILWWCLISLVKFFI